MFNFLRLWCAIGGVVMSDPLGEHEATCNPHLFPLSSTVTYLCTGKHLCIFTYIEEQYQNENCGE